MEFSIVDNESDGKTGRFTVKGRVSAINASAFEHYLEKSLEIGLTHILVDMCQVEFLSSAGIRSLLSVYKKMKDFGGRFHIVNPSENVKNVLGMTALDKMLFK